MNRCFFFFSLLKCVLCPPADDSRGRRRYGLRLCLSVPFSWTRSLRNASMGFLCIWHASLLGLVHGGQRWTWLWHHNVLQKHFRAVTQGRRWACFTVWGWTGASNLGPTLRLCWLDGSSFVLLLLELQLMLHHATKRHQSNVALTKAWERIHCRSARIASS